MKRLIYILIVLLFPLSVFATAQAGDKLIWNGDTLTIFSNPLKSRQNIDLLKTKMFGDRDAAWSTACWRGYIAEWTIIGNELYLTNIFSCNFHEDSIKADLEDVFGSEYENGKVKASWANEEIVIPKGKLIHDINIGYASIYETELVLTFEEGVLTCQEEYDNSKSHKSVFTLNQDSLRNFIHSNIDWKKIPDLKNEKVRVIISLQSGENAKPDNIKIFRKAENEIFNQEAIRAIKLLPDWDVYYKLGKVYRMSWTLPIIFTEEKRKKYAR